jgi:methylmalonyl-CoA mutase N-terminal domain/subunit
VGVNCFQIEDEVLPIALFEVPETLAIQEAKLERIRKERDAAGVEKALSTIARACEQGKNMMEVIVDAVPARITEGEITAVLKRNYGTWNPPLF